MFEAWLNNPNDEVAKGALHDVLLDAGFAEAADRFANKGFTVYYFIVPRNDLAAYEYDTTVTPLLLEHVIQDIQEKSFSSAAEAKAFKQGCLIMHGDMLLIDTNRNKVIQRAIKVLML